MSNDTKQRTQNTWAIWTVAGVILLAALVVGLTSKDRAVTTHNVPVPGVLESPVQVATPQEAPRLDVVFTIDATGSMGDEIDAVKKEIWAIANQLMTGKPRPDIRFGLVFYQDQGDAFLVKKTDLTRDVDKIHGELMAIQAGGGGDWREHVGRGLHESLGLDWDMDAKTSRMIYLVGDAPGHDDYQDGYSLQGAIEKARQRSITIHAIGCSGLDSGREEFQKLAQSTNGRYMDLTYQAVVADQDGQKKSVIHYNGEVYEAPAVLEKAEWGSGADKLIKQGKLKPASGYLRSRAAAPGAATENNLGDVFLDGVKEEAEAKGVAY